MNEVLCAQIVERIPAYLQRREADLNSLKQALEQADLGQIQKIAHNMKGTGASYGFHKITEIGGDLEKAAKAGSRSEIAAGISELSNYLSCLRISNTPSICQFRDGGTAAKPAS